ncbi:SidA/IucD/PvdA family monooxygenase [Streptomyces sp. NPDC014861]|uniref:SidA/IucD/PvdA family monooxygenase n=1 Tax=Streptomyces sp. NPDC014861 TaxID=3364923 RepID=UPI0036FC4BEA
MSIIEIETGTRQGDPYGPEGSSPSAPLLVIGAGPKAVALAAKASVLRDLGVDVPEVVAVERDRTAATWRPGAGYTNGRQRLGTYPEKDLGFPYDRTAWGGPDSPVARRVARRMTGFSWAGHLLAEGRYAEWIDRGRPQPSHTQWADYLEWAAGEANLRVVRGEATRAELHDGGWEVTVTRDGVRQEIHGRGLVVSGQGAPRGGPLAADGERVLSVADFWGLAMTGLPDRVRHVAVVGAGETAGAVVREAAVHQDRRVTVVTPGATLYSRGESLFENRGYSDPAGWTALDEADRREFIRRTDRGVFSQEVQRDLATTDLVAWRPGRAADARRTADGDVAVSVGYSGRRTELRADVVVDATGGDHLWFTGILGPHALDALSAAVGGPITRPALERSIDRALSVAGMAARLHLPNLAGLTQGPGFSNLSSLGLLSDRVLHAHAASVPLPAGAADAAPRHSSRCFR